MGEWDSPNGRWLVTGLTLANGKTSAYVKEDNLNPCAEYNQPTSSKPASDGVINGWIQTVKSLPTRAKTAFNEYNEEDARKDAREAQEAREKAELRAQKGLHGDNVFGVGFL